MAIDASSEWYMVMATFLADKLRELGVSMPGNVVSYDRATQTAQVKPAVTERIDAYTGDEFFFETRPNLFNVPVIWPGGSGTGPGSSYFHPGLEPGDGVLLICTDTDFASWRKNGKLMNPRNDGWHRWTNAVCLPGLNPRPAQLPDSEVVLAAGGVLNSVVVATELRAILNALIAALAAPAAGGPRPATVADFTAVSTALQTALNANNFNSRYIKTGDI